jgi:hypothetical protein
MNKALGPWAAMFAAAVLAGAQGCGEALDTTGLPPVSDYPTWAYFDQYGFVPGHGESWRAIFINPVGRSYTGRGPYPEGTVIVKEIRSLEMEGGVAKPGGLNYLAIMRKVYEPPPGVPTDRGWVFSTKASLDATTESTNALCWDTCHRAAPIDGAFYDYGRVGTDP